MYEFYLENVDRQVTNLDLTTYMQLKELIPSATVVTAICRKSRQKNKWLLCLSVNGVDVVEPSQLMMFDCACELQKHTKIALHTCEKLLKAAEYTEIFILPVTA